MESLESVRRAIQEWRRVHNGRRGPLPHELRGRCGRLAEQLGPAETSAALDIPRQVLERWQVEHVGKAKAPPGSPATTPPTPVFFELKPQMAASAPGARRSGSEVVVEVSGPRGGLVRIRGPLDAIALAGLIRGALGLGG